MFIELEDRYQVLIYSDYLDEKPTQKYFALFDEAQDFISDYVEKQIEILRRNDPNLNYEEAVQCEYALIHFNEVKFRRVKL